MCKKRSAKEIDVLLGAVIRAERLEKSLSIAELAAHLGISPQQLQKYETGQNRIPAGRLLELSLYLEFSLDDILCTLLS